MNCERAEGYLSAFLDNALDPRLSQQVRAHLEDCAHCRMVLDDYRSFDHLLATTARVEPSDALRERLFASDEFRRIREAHEAGIDLSNEADVLAALRSPDLPDGLGDDLSIDADELRLPDMDELPDISGEATNAGDAPPGATLLARVRSIVTSTARSKALLPVAAALILSFGAALLMRQGLFPFGAHTAPGLSTTLGNPGQQGIPLAAGPRVVYLHDGILWSAPENGAGIALPLTATGHGGVTVGAWSVSPTLHLVAYLDTSTNTLHVVRSDGLSDHVVAGAVSGGITWSPDGAHLAYLAAEGGAHTLHVVDSAGGNDVTISSDGAEAGNAVWSGDSRWIAYTETRDGALAIWGYDRTNNLPHQFPAPTGASAALVTQLTWLADTRHPALTWATTDTSVAITGVYGARIDDSSARLLTPAGAHYTAGTYTGANSGGAWLLGDRNSLTLLALGDGSRSTAAVLDAPVSRIVWSSQGVAAVTIGQRLSLWSAPTGLVPVSTGASGSAPAWSADGHSLVYATSGGAQLAQMSGTQVTSTMVLQAADVSALGWAPDDNSVAVATSAGVVLIGPDGSHAKLVDHNGPDGGNLSWSIAG
jgi:WD40 repeat protein